MKLPLKNGHKAWLAFVRKAIDVPLGYSKEDLWTFRGMALRENPSLIPLIEDYLRLAENSETNVQPPESRKRQSHNRRAPAQMHLFDLLREKRFFPQNLDLAKFAARVVPHMRTYRFDKMSRSDIAARVIEYLEDSDIRTRDKLEDSMREALDAITRGAVRDTDRRTFLSRWEKIIKGIEL
jgi:hypothetical protein